MNSREALLKKIKQITYLIGSQPSAVLAGSKEDLSDRDQVLTVFADNILKAIEASKHREFPDYIARVLNSPGFTIQVNRAESKFALDDQHGMAAGYIAFAHHIRFNWSHDAHHLVAELMPHEFWHAYQAVLRAGSQSVESSLSGKSPQEILTTSAPYDTKKEADELAFSIEAGQRRINQYHDLLKKNPAMLTSAERDLLRSYNTAASVYVPCRRLIRVPLRSLNMTPEQMVKQKGVLEAVGEADVKFYPDRYELKGELVIFGGLHVANLNEPEDRGLAFIRDTLYREKVVFSKCYKTQVSFLGKIQNYLIESDAYIAVNPAQFNQVFYPERNAYHTKRHRKYPYLAQLGQASSDSKAADSKTSDPKAAEAKAAEAKVAAKAAEAKAAEAKAAEAKVAAKVADAKAAAAKVTYRGGPIFDVNIVLPKQPSLEVPAVEGVPSLAPQSLFFSPRLTWEEACKEYEQEREREREGEPNRFKID